MGALAKKNFRIWGCGKAIALFVGCLIFSIAGRYGENMSYEQHILSAASDHYYLTYFMLPIALLSCFSFLEDDEEQVILRFGSYRRYFAKKWLSTGIIAAVLVSVQSVAVLLSGIGLKFSNGWQLLQRAVSAELFDILQQFFPTPLHAFAAYALYQLLGTWFVFGICLWIGHFAGRKWSVKILIVAYIISALWIKIPILQKTPLTGLNHWIILHHNLPDRFAVTGITSALLFLIILVSLWFMRWSKVVQFPTRKGGVTIYYLRELVTKQNILILFAVVVGIVLYKGLGNSWMTSGEEWVCTLFAGHGTGYFRIFPFLEMLILNSAPLYLLAIFVERIISGQSIFVSIRTKGQRSLFIGLISASIIFIAIYVVLWFIGGTLGGIIFGYSMDAITLRLLIGEMCLKYLDILVQYLVMITLYLFTKQITVGFLALVAGNMLSITPVQWVNYLPFGLSSTTRLELLDIGFGIPLTKALGIAGACALAVGLWLLGLGYRKLYR